MRYTSVLDTEQFTSAVVAAAGAAATGNCELERKELGRAFDLLADARNHVYSVDFYVVDVTLLAGLNIGRGAASTNWQRVRQRICSSPANKLIGLRSNTRTRCGIEARSRGWHGVPCRRHVSRWNCRRSNRRNRCWSSSRPDSKRPADTWIANTKSSASSEPEFSPLLPVVLKNLGFRGALHAAFDGGRLPRADQRKTNWGAGDGSIDRGPIGDSARCVAGRNMAQTGRANWRLDLRTITWRRFCWQVGLAPTANTSTIFAMPRATARCSASW